MFSLVCAWTNDWASHGDTGDLRRHHAHYDITVMKSGLNVTSEMCSERDSPLEPFVLPAPGQPELARLTCGAHLGPPVLTRKQKRPRVNSLVCDRAAAFCAAGPPEALFWMSRLVTQAAKHERELARAHSQRLKQATLSLPGESISRGFADRGALEGYPSHYTSLVTSILIMSFLIWSFRSVSTIFSLLWWFYDNKNFVI